MSFSLLEDFEPVVERVVMGVKNLVKRRGVMEGCPLGLLLTAVEDGAAVGDVGKSTLLLCGEHSISMLDMMQRQRQRYQYSSEDGRRWVVQRHDVEIRVVRRAAFLSINLLPRKCRR